MEPGHRDSRFARLLFSSVGRRITADRKECGRWRARSAAWLLALAVAPFGQVRANGNAFVELSGGFKSGDFGTAVRSDLRYVAPAVGYLAPGYDFSATVPYLRLNTDSGGTSATESGIGDIVARAGKVLAPDAFDELSLYGSVAVKLPTADEDKGLGTGETDLGAFLAARWPLGNLRLNLQGGYIKSGLGHSEGLRDVFLYSAGLSGATTRAHWYVSLDGRTALVQGARAPLEISGGSLYALGGRYFLKGSAFAGLNEGGPAFGVAGGIVRMF
ncbi:MAG: hypothetical protein WC809_00075 [Sinimarinibacterium sp.]|jgi:hypothetical protein